MSEDKTLAVVPTVGHFLAHMGRMVVFFCTAGFAYPNVMIEGLDPTAIQSLTQGDLYKTKPK